MTALLSTPAPAESLPGPDRIMDLGAQFMASKTLMSAVELNLFSELANGPLDGETLRNRLDLHPRGTRDFFDALVALGLLRRDRGRYANTPETHLYLDRAKPTYIGGVLEINNARLYPYWGSLTEGLRTGRPQNEGKDGRNFLDEIYRETARLRQFLAAMTGLSLGVARVVAERFPWGQYRSFFDIGCAQGALPVQVALAHPHLSGGGFDLAPVRPVFEEYVASFGLDDRLGFLAGDFFADPLPTADVLVMGHILHDWDLDQKRLLLAKAYAALPAGGALIVYDAMIDDERRRNALGLLMSLTMLIETPGGFDYTGAECRGWLHEAGFHETHIEPLVGGHSMAVAVK